MAHKSLSELRGACNQPTPYSASITVQVVKVGHSASFTDLNGQPGEILNFSIADETGAMLATLIDRTKHCKIVEGKTLHVRQFVVKNNKIAMSHRTSIMGRPRLEIPEGITQTAIQLILPASPDKKVVDAKEMPLRSILTVKGQVTKNEATKTVKVNGNDTTIRTITLQDDGETIDVTLWREIAVEERRIGEFLRISHCLLNEWQGRKSLNSTRNTSIEQIQPLDVEINGKVEALSVSEMSFDIAIKENGKNFFRDFQVEFSMMKEAFAEEIEDIDLMETSEVEELLLAKIPFPVKLRVQGCQ
ncbi:uncharacterized protein LOC134262282, partial [Saccostrea cucullata]|uniref:uncharacterized protein LOC134262282 n=1 Tax=Saccostrea cuccullata TaxID=36930 RepID=UPI002ED24419